MDSNLYKIGFIKYFSVNTRYFSYLLDGGYVKVKNFKIEKVILHIEEKYPDCDPVVP